MTTSSRLGAARTTDRLASLLIAAALVCAHAGVAAAQTGAFSGDVSGLSDQEVDQRFEFIRERLDEGQLNAQIWQYGFTSGWGLGVAIGATQAGVASDKIPCTG